MQTLQTSVHSFPLSSTAKRRVLIVDDEQNLTDLLRRCLARLGPGLDVQVANSGAQALNLLDDGQFDLLITDYQMPKINGLQLAKAVRQRYPRVKIILMTAFPSPQVEGVVDKLAVNYYLVKPFSSRDLREIVCQLLILPAPFSSSSSSQGGDGRAASGEGH